MKYLNIILQIYLATIFSSCEKESKGDFYIQGKVINIGLNTPIDSVQVILYGGNPLSNPLMSDFNDSPPAGNNDTAYSNSNGEFELEIHNETACFLGWNKDGYKKGEIIWYNNNYTLKREEGGNKFFRKGETSIIIEYEAKCTFSPVFMKKGNTSTNDSLIVSVANYRTPKSFIKLQTFLGLSPFELNNDYGHAIGDTYFYYKLDYTDSKKWKQKIDSVYIRSFENFTDTIYFQ